MPEFANCLLVSLWTVQIVLKFILSHVWINMGWKGGKKVLSLYYMILRSLDGMTFSTIWLGGCNNPKYFIVPDILTGGYILRSFAKKIMVVALNSPPQPSIWSFEFFGKLPVIMVSVEALWYIPHTLAYGDKCGILKMTSIHPLKLFIGV
jgi:hypothetical protein